MSSEPQPIFVDEYKTGRHYSLVVEMAGRRLSLWKRSPATAPDAVTELSVDPDFGYKERWFSRKRRIPTGPVTMDPQVVGPGFAGQPGPFVQE